MLSSRILPTLISVCAVVPSWAAALDVTKYNFVTCHFHDKEIGPVSALLGPDDDYDEGDPESRRFADKTAIIKGKNVGMLIRITPEPHFFVQLRVDNEYCEVGIVAEDVSSVDLACGTKASARCEID